MANSIPDVEQNLMNASPLLSLNYCSSSRQAQLRNGLDSVDWTHLLRTTSNPALANLRLRVGPAGSYAAVLLAPLVPGVEVVALREALDESSSPDLAATSALPPQRTSTPLRHSLHGVTDSGLGVSDSSNPPTQDGARLSGADEEEANASSSGIAASQILPSAAKKRRTRAMLPCSMCGKEFDRPSLLKRHMRTHTG